MPESSEITRRWSGYICPDCRFVFRVPKDHDGTGLVCPSCRRLLKLPVAGEPLQQLVLAPVEAPPPAVVAAEQVEPPQGELRKRRRHSGKDKDATPSWEHGKRTRTLRPEKLLMAAMVAGALILLLVALLVSRRSKPEQAAAPMPVTPSPIELPVTPPSPIAKEDVELGGELDIREFLRLAEPMARTFLNAKSVEELLPVIRHPKTTGPRLGERHPDGNLQPPGFQSFAEGGAIQIDRTSAVVKVLTGTFEQRNLSFARTRDGWKIDWESWVGWSDLSWEQFKDKAPTTPSRFRVRLKPIIYYNFSFSDDTRWRSYLIESPDGSERYFGYVERGSRVDDLINFADSPSGGDFILALSFPAENTGRNQVLITDRIAVGWIEPESADSP